MTTEQVRGSTIGERHDGEAAVRWWLFVVAGLVFAMVVVGGATRLTDSGLSITEWLPILGAIPPLNEADWWEAFEKYKKIPEYELVNKGMSLAEFQFIYWWEWAHRFLGRAIGIVFALPFAYFWWTGRLRPWLAPKLLGILALGGLQGFVGWYMVQSGLSERVDVSQYRLALHLTIAFVIFALLVWTALGLYHRDGSVIADPVAGWQKYLVGVLVGLILVQVVLGGFVAGLKAGLAYNTWPLMEGALLPDGLWSMSPWYLNLAENMLTVQFNHRIAAYIVLLLTAVHVVVLLAQGASARVLVSAGTLLVLVVVQALIGIWTLLAAPAADGIPIGLGLLHQGGAVVVLGVGIWHLHRVWRG